MKYSIITLFFCLTTMVALAQENKYLGIQNIEWSAEHKVLQFNGRADLPVGTKIKVVLSLHGQTGPVQFLRIQQAAWEGYFGPFPAELVPGEYVLTATIAEMSSPEELKKLETALGGKKLEVTKTYSYLASSKEATWKKLQEKLIHETMELRPYYDRILQKSQLILLRSKNSPDHKQEHGKKWAEAVATLPDWKEKQKSLIQKYQDAAIIFPYQLALTKILHLVGYLHQLQFVASQQVLEATGVATAKPGEFDVVLTIPVLIQHILQAPREIFKHLEVSDIYWGISVKVPKERGSVESKQKMYVSRASKFRFGFETFPKEMKPGEENSPERLTLMFHGASLPVYIIQVQMVQFEDYETPEEKIKAWELLASYEWELYTKQSGKFVTVQDERTQKGKKVYELVFTTQGEKFLRLVKTYLYFSSSQKSVVYAIVYINLLGTEMDHHGSPGIKQNLDRMIRSFEVIG